MTSLRMDAHKSVLVMVDFQERLMPAIADGENVLARAGFLTQVARELQVPVIGTAQNPGRLGPNLPPVADRLDRVVEKMTFGGGAGGLDSALYAYPDRPEVVVAGCEAHVCLLQTALELLAQRRRLQEVVLDLPGEFQRADREPVGVRRADATGGQ